MARPNPASALDALPSGASGAQSEAARARVETTLSFDERVATVERIYAELAEAFPRPAGRRLGRCA